MTTETLDHLRSQISTLSESERAALARELIMSLDGPRDDSVEQASVLSTDCSNGVMASLVIESSSIRLR